MAEIGDIGPHYISVTAIGSPLNNTHASVATDIFTVHVREEQSRAGKTRFVDEKALRMKESRCPSDEPSVTLTILLDVDLGRMTATERRVLLESAEKELGIRIDRLRLHSRQYAHSFEQEPLMAGPGAGAAQAAYGRANSGSEPDADADAASDATTALCWQIGCGARVSSELHPEVSRIEQLAGSGRLAARLRYGILSWQVREATVRPSEQREGFS